MTAIRRIRASLKGRRITTIELAHQLHMDSASLSDYLFFRKMPSDALIDQIERAIEFLEMGAHVKATSISTNVATFSMLNKEQPVASATYTTTSQVEAMEAVLDHEIQRSADKKRLSQAVEADQIEPGTSFSDSQPPAKLGEKIQDIRTKLGLSPAQLAASLHPAVNENTVLLWEADQVMPLLDYCIQISDMGVVTLDWLLRD